MPNGISKDDLELVTRLTSRDSGPAGAELHSIEAWRQGSFTIVHLDVTLKTKGRPRRAQLVGVAKRNCNDDEDDPRRARNIAIARALRGDAVPIK